MKQGFTKLSEGIKKHIDSLMGEPFVHLSSKSIQSLQAHETDGLFKQISVMMVLCSVSCILHCVLEKQSCARLTCEEKVRHA